MTSVTKLSPEVRFTVVADEESNRVLALQTKPSFVLAVQTVMI